MKLNYDTLYIDFIKYTGIEENKINKILKDECVEIEEGPHIIFEYAISNYIIDCINKKEDEILAKVFDFVEIMLNSEKIISEVADFSILEPVISNCEDSEYIIKFLKTQSLKDYYSLSTYYGK